jgi:uncharacterized MAPEG superfamily protein
MPIELRYLTYVTLLTGLAWAPYILNAIVVRGLVEAVGYPSNPKPLAPWAERMKAAHYNAVENLVVFATLVLVAHAVGAHGQGIVTSSIVYFWARAVHLAAYTFGIPGIRTLAFVTGVGCQLCIACHILCG